MIGSRKNRSEANLKNAVKVLQSFTSTYMKLVTTEIVNSENKIVKVDDLKYHLWGKDI